MTTPSYDPNAAPVNGQTNTTSSTANPVSNSIYQKLGYRAVVDHLTLEFTALRLLGAHQRSRTPEVEASMLKVRGTELRQAIYALLVEMAGPAATAFSREAQFLEHLDEAPQAPELATLAANMLDSRKVSIYGGTNEVQRNLMARAVLNAW